MKIKTSAKKEKLNSQFKKYWIFSGLILLVTGAFFFGLTLNQDWNPAETLNKIKNLVIKTDKTLTEELRREIGLYNANGLETVFIDIPFESLMALEKKRNEALIAGILLTSDEDFVPASMHLVNQDPFDIKLRLKGDWTDHLQGEKWSFRIHIQDDKASLLSMRRFSLQAPETRNYEKEWGFHQNLFQENILTTRYYFINVVINGEYRGIYALEESFTQDLLESQERREGIIIRFNEDLLWKNWENLDYEISDMKKVGVSIGEFWITNVSNSEITPFRGGRISKDEILESEMATAIELLHSFEQGKLAGEEVFDLELWGKYFAVTDLWGAAHATAWHNLRFYYNPLTGLLEPIAYDALPFESSMLEDKLAYPFSSQGFSQEIFNIPGVQKSYVETLERVTSSSYLKRLEESIGHEMEHYHEVLSGPLEKGVVRDIPVLPWEELHQRAFVLAQNLTSPQPLQSNYQLFNIEGQEYLQLDVTNLMVVPVQINEFVIDKDTFPFEKTWCMEKDCHEKLIPNIEELVILENESVKFLIPKQELGITTIPSEELSIKANLYGGSYVSDNPVNSNYVPRGVDSGVKPVVSLEETLATHPFLIISSTNVLSVLPGDWDVVGDLIIPENYTLRINANTTLRFGTGNILLSYGRLDILGTHDAPVLLTAKENNWSGIVVLGDTQKSTWEHAQIEKMSGINRRGWILTGGITFYQSPVNLTNVVIGNNKSEDALNIIQTSYTLDNVKFINTASDAFDGDFTKGQVINSSFQDIGGDAIDISGSVATIANTFFTNIGDKAVSVGEESIVYIENIDVSKVNIGIASKDSSEISVHSATIKSAKVAGLAAYIKKPQYGPASIQATNIHYIDTETPTLCQLESVIIIDGEAIPEESFDTSTLY